MPRRLFTLFFVFLMICARVQAATYYWVGGATGNWSVLTNWATSEGGTGGDGITQVPETGDTVNITTASTITLDNTVSIANLILPRNKDTTSVTITSTGTNTLTVTDGITVYHSSDNNTSTLIFDCDVIVTALEMRSGANVTVNEGKTANITTITNAGGTTLPSKLTVNGTLISSAIAMSNTSNRTIEVGSTGKITTGTLTGSTGSVTNEGLIVTQTTPDTGLITSSGSGTSTVAEAGAFVWTGDTDNDWTDGTNWLEGTAPTASDTTADINIPKVSQLPEIPAGTSLSFATVNLIIDTDANITVNGGLELTGTSTPFDLSKINTNSSGTLTVAGTLENTSAYVADNLTISCGALTTSAGIKCTKLSVTGESTISETTTIESTGTAGAGGTGGISFGSAVNQTGSITLTAAAPVTFGADSSFENLSITAGTSVTTGSNLTVKGNWTNAGTFTASAGTVTFTGESPATGAVVISGDNNFKNLVIQNSAKITGSNSIAALTVNSADNSTGLGGKQITFTAATTQTISGALTIKGSSTTSRLQLRSSSTGSQWKISCGSSEINFVDIQDAENISTDYLFALNSNDSGNNTKWNFPGMEYTWTGATTVAGKQNDWNTATNWSPASIPGSGAVITIDAVTNHPILTQALDIKTTINGTDFGTIQVATGATFDLAEQNLTATSITNNGTVRLFGSQTIDAAMSNGTSTNSTVEYYVTGTGSTLSTFAWNGGSSTEKAYTNLTISRDVSIADKITVSGKTIINAGANLTNTANSFSSTGKVKIGDYSSTPKILTGDVTLYSSAAVTIDDTAYAQSFTAYCPVNIHDITTTGDQTYNGTVTLIDTTNLISTGTDKHIYFNNNVSGSATLNAQATNININCDTIETTGSQTYTGAVILDKNTELKSTATSLSFSSTIDGAKELTISTTAGTTFNANVGNGTGTELAKLTVEGPLNINCEVVKTSGNQSYSGTVTLVHDTNLSVTGSTGTITFDSAATIDGTKALTLSTTAGTSFGANVGSGDNKALTNLTITGPLTIKDNCASITTKKVNGSEDTTGIQTYNGTVTLNRDTTLNAENKILYKADITQNNTEKTLTINSPEFKSIIEATGTPETETATITLDILQINHDTTLDSANGTYIVLNVSEIQKSVANSTEKLTFGSTAKAITLKDEISVSPDVTNNGSVSCSGTASFYGTVENNGTLAVTSSDTTKTLTFEKNYSGSGSLTASKGTTTFKADAAIANSKLTANGGTIILTAANKTGGATATLSGNNTFNTLTLQGPVTLSGTNTITDLNIQDSVTISASNTITNLTANKTGGLGGKTITFGNGTEQTISGDLILKGSDADDNKRLLLVSSTPGSQWEIKCDATSTQNIEFVDVKDSKNTSDYYLFAIHSWDTGNNTKWNFPGMKYVWTGAYSTDPTNWNVATNWEQLSIPGKGADVEIPAGCTNYPILTAELNLNEEYNSVPYCGKITIKPEETETNKVEGKLDLAGSKLILGADGQITNNGLVRLIGASGQTINGKMINGTGSTVEYYSGTNEDTANFPWDGDNGTNTAGKQYANLIIKKAVTQSTSNGAQLIVTGTTTIAAGTGKIVSLNNSSNIFKGNVIVGKDDTANPVNAGIVTLNGIGKDTDNNDAAIFIENNVLADSLTINSNIRGLTLSINAPLSINADSISTTGNQTYKQAVTLVKNLQLNSTTGTIVFCTSSQIDGTKELTISTTAGTTFNANVGNGTGTELAKLTVEGPLNINCEVVKTSGNQSYSGAVTLVHDTNLSVTGSTGTITFDSAAIIDGTKALTLSTTAGTSFGANVGSGENKALTNLTITGPLTIKDNCASITTKKVNGSEDTTGIQTYNGTVTLNRDTTLNAENKILYKADIIQNDTGKTLTINTPEFNSIIGATGTPETETATITLDILQINHDTTLDSANGTYIVLNVSEIQKSVANSTEKLTFGSTAKAITLKDEISVSPDVTNNGRVSCSGTASFNGTVENNGTLAVTSSDTTKTLTFEKDYSGSGSLTASKGTTIFKADAAIANSKLTANGGTIILTAANKTGGAAATLSGNNTFNILTIQGPVTICGTNRITDLNIQDSVTISANNTITRFTANKTGGLGGKTITFGADTTQEVTEKLTLRGTAETDGNRLNLRSSTPTTESVTGTSWKINCTGTNQHDIEFVDIQDSNNITSLYYLFALNSIDHGNNTKWNFPGMKYVWTGANSTDPTNWNVAANWEKLSIPGKGADVEIPAGCTYYPKLTEELNLYEEYQSNHYYGKITIKPEETETNKVEGKLDLAGSNLILGADGQITNNGLVRLIGAAGQTINGKMINGTGSTVEYCSGTNEDTANFPWDGDNGTNSAGKQYANLIIKKAVTQSTSSGAQLIVSGTTTIAAGTGKTVTLNNESNNFTGNVITGSSTGTTFIAGVVTLNAGSLISLGNNANADSLAVNSSVKLQNVTTTGDQTYNGTVTLIDTTNLISTGTDKHIYFNNNVSGSATLNAQATNININCDTIETTGSQTYTGAVILDKNTELKSTAASLSFSSTIDGAKALKVASSTGTTFGGTVGAVTNLNSLEIYGAADINCASITTTGLQIYKGAVLLSTATTLTSTANNITLDSTLNGNNTITISVPMENTITVRGLVGEATPPSVSITQAGTVTFEETVKAAVFTLVQTNNTIFTNTVEIQTFTDTTDSGNISFLNSGMISNTSGTEFLTNGTVSFGNETNDTMLFGNSTAAANLTHSNGDTSFTGTLNAASIVLANTSTNGTLNAGSTQINNITLNGDTSVITQGIQNYNGTINDSVAGTHQLLLNSNNSPITFAQNIGEAISPKLLSVTGPVAINCLLVKTTESQTYNAAITGTGSITLETADINLNCSTIATDGSQTFRGAALLQSDTTLTSDTGDIHFTSTLNGAHKFTLAKSNTSTFDGTVEITDFEITQAATTNFNAIVTIGSFTDTASSGNIIFKNGGTISNSEGTTFLTTGTVTFGDAADDIIYFGSASPYASLTHTAGTTSLTGSLFAANLTLGETTGGPMTINNSGLFKTTDGSALTYSTGFTQNGTGNSILGGSFTGNGNASFATYVQLYGTAPADFGSADKNISINKNLIISRNASLSTQAELAITNNLVIYNGDVTVNADISAGDDILLLGNTYKIKDNSTGIEDEFAYKTPRHSNWSQPNYNETELPDGTTLPQDYTGSLTIAADKKITAGKNFYVNGSSMILADSAGQWILSLPDISDPSKAFAEAYYTSISGCKVIYSSTDSAISSTAKEDGTYARLTALECTDNGTASAPNQNVEFDDFMITSVYTVRDNAIRVEFNQPIRYHANTINSLRFHNVSNEPNLSFTGFYSDPDCAAEHELKSDIQLSYLNPEDNKTYYYFYIKAAPQDSAITGAWNTDATGKSIGAENEKSSDRDGIHHTNIPCLDFPRSLTQADGTTLSFIITDRWGKRLNNYSKRPSENAVEPAYGSASSSKEVADKTGPVLWSVRTGQELHTTYNPSTGEASQHSYDSHNFLELRYSEPVEFYEAENQRTITENFQVTDALGAVAEDITAEHNTMTFAGLVKLNAASGTNLKLYTGIDGTPSKYMNALYRPDEYSVRVSIAGWTDGTVTDYSGNTYKKWSGYIEAASQFTNATAVAFSVNNASVKDLAQNNQIEYSSGSRKEPIVLSDSSGNHTASLLPVSPDLYSKWDISSPYFTPLRIASTSTAVTADNAWSSTNERSEAIGNTNGTGSTLDRIDFHFFDNTPKFDGTDEAEWFTEVGWCLPGTTGSKSNLKDSSYTYAADIIGGARQFDTTASRRTAGGIRLSTKLSVAPGFKYSSDPDETPETAFATGLDRVHSTVVSQLFTGSSEPRHAANDPDGLYLGLGITDTALPVETTFAFAYDENLAYLTDLAGNRLRSKTSKTIDRTPPSFDIILSPVNQNQIYIVFVKQIVTDGEGIKICDADGNPQSVDSNLLSLLPDCFQLVRIAQDGTYTAADENDIAIDSSIPASIVERYSDNHFTCICLRTTRNITFDDVRNLHIQLKNHKAWPEKSQDPFTSNKNARVTFIQDYSGNYMQMYSAHALSDFAINYVNPLYAYSSDITEDENPVMDGLYENGSWAVHNWNADQNKYGTLPADHAAAIVAALESGAEAGANQNIRVYLSDSPDRDSVSTQFNKDFKTSLRVWLPDLSDGVYRALTATNNSNYSYVDSEIEDENLIFNIPLEMIQKWKSGDQISFMFGVTNSDGSPVKIYNNPYFDIENNRYDFSHNIPVPLYSLRMHDNTDIGTLDLWSFRLKGITGQRGGVTILNNVIDAGRGEKTVIKVDVPSEGKLSVIVMTLDGNIITYLHRGNAKSGENYFTWDGKNRSGSPVARGMYFIRVVGTDFDETRKVMVVK